MRIDDRRLLHPELEPPRDAPSPRPAPSAQAGRDLPEASAERDRPELLAFYATLRASVTDAGGGSRDAMAQRAMNELRDAYSGPYSVGGASVGARPMFRLNQGANEASMQAHARTLDALASRAGVNGASLRNGCASPRDLVKVTQALIDAGHLPSGPGDAASCIRRMQWTFGIGVDCAGYTRRAFLAANGISERETKGLGLASLGNEAFRGLDGNRHFEKIAPADVRPGDIITLDPKPGGRWGHNLVVHGNTVADERTRAAFAAQHGPEARAFLRGSGPFHVIEVDSSWGAGADGADYGGFRRDTWLYDRSTREWGYLDPTTSPPAFAVSNEGPASEDDYHGAYRAKLGR